MKAIKKTLVISITGVLAALTFGSCSSDELATTVTPKQEQQQGKTITMNVHLEASAGQEMPSGDPSTRGLQLKYTQKIPFFTANVDKGTGKKRFRLHVFSSVIIKKLVSLKTAQKCMVKLYLSKIQNKQLKQ